MFIIYISKIKNVSKLKQPSILTSWEVLGPFIAGKLEVDGDPAFEASQEDVEGGMVRGDLNDVAVYLLSMDDMTTTAYSELVAGGVVRWRTQKAEQNGQVS
jgi:hypothetical protein